jgi:hypothetical protein
MSFNMRSISWQESVCFAYRSEDERRGMFWIELGQNKQSNKQNIGLFTEYI